MNKLLRKGICICLLLSIVICNSGIDYVKAASKSKTSLSSNWSVVCSKRMDGFSM